MNYKRKKIALWIIVCIAIVEVITIAVLLVIATPQKRIEEQLRLADQYLAELEYEEAIALYKEIIKIDPKCEAAYLGLADVYIEMEEYDLATEVLKTAEIESEEIVEKLKEVKGIVNEIAQASEEIMVESIQLQEQEEITVPTMIEEVPEQTVENNWREIYIQFLSDLTRETEWRGEFVYVDGDEIPELIIDKDAGPVLYKIYNGQIVEVNKSETDGMGGILVCEKKSVYVFVFGDAGYFMMNYYFMNGDGSTSSIKCFETDGEETWSEYWLDSKEVSESDYYKQLKNAVEQYGEARGGYDFEKSITQLIQVLESDAAIPMSVLDIYEISLEPTRTDYSGRAYKLYEELLYNVRNGNYPDGSAGEFYADDANRYAYSDIDGDGVDELIIEISATYTAGQVTYIYGYNVTSDSVYEKYVGSVDSEIYNNGKIVSLASHNQSLSYAVWPYILYTCNRSGIYEAGVYIDAWDGNEFDSDYSGNAFPSNVDADGNGLVYSMDGVYVDDAKYDEWYKSNVGNAKLLSFNWIDI